MSPENNAALTGASSSAELALPATTGDVTPFKVEVSQAALEDLRRRLGMTRWPERETASDWSQGVPLDKMQALVSYWAQGYDWRAAEARSNALWVLRIAGAPIKQYDGREWTGIGGPVKAPWQLDFMTLVLTAS